MWIRVEREPDVNGEIIIIAGPCAVESRAQVEACAEAVANLGITMFRGGAFKPRTSKDSFQGLGLQGLKLLRDACQPRDLDVVTECLDVRDLEAVTDVAAWVQIGARNMRNYTLLREAGRCGRTVLLKRGLAATVKEWLLAAEYAGDDVVLCERGHRTFMDHCRFMLDLAAISEAKQAGFRVIADPSHAAGRRDLVAPLALAALAAGADGLIVEMHVEPDTALCDGPQQLRPPELAALIAEAGKLWRALRS